MTAILPALVDQPLHQGRDPDEIPDISQQAATGRLGPLASRVLGLVD